MLDDLLQGFVMLTDEAGQEEEYQVIRVLEMQDLHYVLLQSVQEPNEEPLVLRIEGDIETDNATLVGIDDDEEWERVAEAFDTLMFELDDMS